MAVARETSVDLIRATTEDPEVRPRASTASLVIAAVSSPPSTETFTEPMAPPVATSVTVPASWLRMLRLMGNASPFPLEPDYRLLHIWDKLVHFPTG